MSFEIVLRKIRSAFLVAAFAMAAFGVASYFAIGRLADLASQESMRQDKLMLLEQLEGRLSRAQSSLRAYILSAADADLQAFEALAWEQKSTLQKLSRGAPLPEQAQLQQLVAERTLLQYDVATVRRRGDSDGAVNLLGSMRFLEVDTEIADLVKQARAREQHAWSTASAVPTAAAARHVVLAGVGLLLAMLGWVFWIVRRYERERRRVTRLLDDSAAISRALAGNMAEGLLTLGEDLTVHDINPAALRLLGYSRDEVVGSPVAQLIAPYPGRGRFRRRLRDLIARPEPFRIAGADMMLRRRSGQPMPAQVSLNDVRLAGHRRLTALIRDMSGIHAATEAARASERHLREMTDTLPVLIAEMDTELRLRFLNRACAEFLGIPAEEAIGAATSEALGAELFALHAPHMEEALRGKMVCYQVAAADAQGEVGTYDMRLVPRRDASSGALVGFYAFATDITELKRIDTMKTEFVSTVSHELRTPLTSIRGSLGLMTAGVAGKLPESAVTLVGIAQSNCDRLIRLINDILDTEKIESGKLPLRLQTADLGALARKSLQDNESFARQQDVRLDLHVAGGPLLVQVDVDRLLQVLTNLLSNAVKFSPPGQAVEVRVSGTPSLVRVEVADRGPGIPLEFHRRIFQKFSQADSSDTRARGGTGLGLNISRTLVQKMGGQIGFTSTPGAGSTFFFELPRWDAPPGSVAPVPRACSTPVRRRRHILHVEGDGDIRAVVSGLVAERATCVSAGSLQDARGRLAERVFDLVLIEPELQDGSGWELLEELGRAALAPPVIVFSARDAEPPPGARPEAVLVKAHTTEARLVEVIRTTLDKASTTQPAPLES